MARARNIKPGFFTNEDLSECSMEARLCFAGLWMLADRAGRLEDRPKRVKGELFRFDNVDVEPLLCELAQRGFILRYEADGARFIQVVNFAKHQTPHYSEKVSVIKPPQHQEDFEKVSVIKVAANQETSKIGGAIKGGSQPPDSLILRVTDSEEKQTAPAEPVTEKPKAMSAKERVWSLGPEIVGGADAGARTFLGKLVAAHGEDVVDAALSACAIEQPGAPRPWLLKACEAQAKTMAAMGRKSGAVSGDDKPAWAIRAGFANRFEAGNEGCFEHTATQFRDGKRIGVTA